MRPDGPTFWLLNEAAGWRTARAAGVAVGADLRLAAAPGGALALDCADGSLGGLALPQHLAIDGSGLVHLLDRDALRVKRFDPAACGFTALPALGGAGSDARALRAPAAIRVVGGDLWIADAGNRRVQVVVLATLALRAILGPWDRAGQPVAADDPRAWVPVDVAAEGATAVILDGRWGRVYVQQPGRDTLRHAIDGGEAARGRWTRVLLDTAGRIYLLAAADRQLDIYDQQGRSLGSARDAGEVRGRFRPVPIRVDERGRFCLPPGLARDCGRRSPAAAPAPADPLALCRDTGLIFDAHGNAVTPPAVPEVLGAAPYRSAGTWLSGPLDGAMADCQWHRVALRLADLPAGTQVRISTYSDAEPRTVDEVGALPEGLWSGDQVFAGAMQDPTGGTASSPLETDVLIQSPPGRWLWLRLTLRGDGYETPVVTDLRCHYPRQSYLEHLPAVFGADAEGRRFLEHFLALFQSEWDALEARLDDLARLFDPAAVPEGPFLEYLSAWLALPQEEDWSGQQRRRLLATAPRLYPRRGTPAAVRDYLRVYLANLTGIEPAAQRDYPLLVEGFRRRDRLTIAVPGQAGLGLLHPLWGPAEVARLQLGVHARAGEVRLVSTGDPDHDRFQRYAHRFQVYVPAVWVRGAAEERALRRAIDSEKPAHTAYDLCLVEARARVGLQSTLGLDTIIGDWPRAVLGGAQGQDLDAPSRTPRSRLGLDTVLGSVRDRAAATSPPCTRVGFDTRLA
jgi:phage tail-like protein